MLKSTLSAALILAISAANAETTAVSAAPVCKFPDQVQIKLTWDQGLALLQLSQGHDDQVSVSGAKGIAATLMPQLQAMHDNYCKVPK